MGKAATSTEQTPVPRTRCSQCRTVFEIAPELLASPDTRVRCGECFAIFDALENLRGPDAADERDDAGAGGGADGGADPSPSDEGDATDGTGAVLARAADDVDAYAEGYGGDDGFDVTYSDFDLFSADAELPAVAYPDDTSDTAEFGLGTVPEAGTEAAADACEARDGERAGAAPGAAADEDVDEGTGGRTGARSDDTVPDEPASGEAPAGEGPAEAAGDTAPVPETSPAETPEEAANASTPARAALARGGGSDEGDAAVASGGAPAPVPADPPFLPAALPASVIGIDEPVERPPARSGAWALRGLMVLVLASLLVGLYLYRERERLHNDPLGRPLLTLACRISGCLVPSRVELASLRLLDKEVFTHPSAERALVINVAFRNTAEFAQRYPVLVVRLRDRVGRSVAERDFAPADYLDEWSPGDTLSAGRRLDISLEVDDPGDGAESYEFEFREADA